MTSLRVSALSASSALNQIGYAYDAASRLGTVTSGANTASYGYVANSPLVGTVTFAQGGTTRLTTTKSYDNLNRLTSISNLPSAISQPLSHAYTYNSANQRTRVARENDARWDYTYDALGQVISGKKSGATGVTLPGHDFAWSFDDIGNRRSASRNASSSEALAKEDYTANLLNQYTQRTVPGAFEVLAAAEPGATVTRQYPAETGTPVPLAIYGDLRHAQLTADNTLGSVKADVKITGVKNNVGPAGEDAVTEFTRSAYLPKSPEVFTHDADGNLTGDGRWLYGWDGENRLKSAETTQATQLAGVPRQKLLFNYDGQGRRVAKVVTDYPGAEYSALSLDYYAAANDAQVGPILATRSASRWNLAWPAAEAPAPGVPPTPWITQIRSTLQVPVSGDYTFNVTMGPVDALRLYLNDVFVLNLWNFNGPRTGQVTLALQAGQVYQLRCQFYNGGSDSSLQLQASTATGADATTRFLYDGWNLLAEVDATGAAAKTYAWGSDLSGSMQGAGGVGGLLFAQTLDPSTQTLKPHGAVFDGNGNVSGLVDMATGAKSATYEYGAFGETLIADGVAAEAMPFRFSTRYTDSETGIIMFPLRPYSPSSGRFLCKDPIEEQGGLNLYGFSANDGVNSIDPLGLVVVQGILGEPIVVRLTAEVDWERDSRCCWHVKIAGEAEVGLGAGIGARVSKAFTAQVGIMLAGIGRKQTYEFTICPDGTGHLEADLQLLNFSKFLSQGIGVGSKKIGIEVGVSFDLDIEVNASIHIIATSTAANISGRVAGFVETSGGAGISFGDYSLGSSSPKKLGGKGFNKTLFETTVHYQ